MRRVTMWITETGRTEKKVPKNKIPPLTYKLSERKTEAYVKGSISDT